MRIKDLLIPSNVVQYKTPIVVAKTFTDQISSATNWIVTPPTTPVAGRLLLVFVGTIQARTPAITGWTSVTLTNIVGSKGHAMLWKVSNGTETSITVTFGGSGSQGAACYYEIDNVDTTTTFYDLGSSANQEPPGDPYFTAVSNPFTITRPSIAFSATVFIGSGSEWAPNNDFIYNGNRLSACAHRVYKNPAAADTVTWSRVGGTTSATKVSMIEIFGKVNTDKSVNYKPTVIKPSQGQIAYNDSAGASLFTQFVNFATSPKEGELMLAFIYWGGATTPVGLTIPPGWEPLVTGISGTNPNAQCYWKIAGPSEPTTHSWTTTTAVSYEIIGITVPGAKSIASISTSTSSAINVTTINSGNIANDAGAFTLICLMVSGSGVGAVSPTNGYGYEYNNGQNMFLLSKKYSSALTENCNFSWGGGRRARTISVELL